MKLAPATYRTILFASLMAVLLGCSSGTARAPLGPPADPRGEASTQAPRQKLAGPAPNGAPAEDARAPYTIDNPYAVAGVFRKSQLHLHTANSFDGDKNFPPDVT